MFGLYETNTLITSLQCQFTETTIRGKTCRPSPTHYPDSEPSSLSSYSMKLRAKRRSSKYQFYSLWFDPTGARTHILPHSRRARLTITPPMRLENFEIYIINVLKQINFSTANFHYLSILKLISQDLSRTEPVTFIATKLKLHNTVSFKIKLHLPKIFIFSQ